MEDDQYESEDEYSKRAQFYHNIALVDIRTEDIKPLSRIQRKKSGVVKRVKTFSGANVDG